MPFWALIVWLVIGGAAGILAGKFMGQNRPFGLIGDIGLGVVGSVIGGYLLALMGMGSDGMVGTFITAFIGALILIWIVRKIKSA